ncbi:hypothetical protein GCM10009087_42900 [Sphingomonas oligophenolica]|uniref:Uncharacterized protein n=1 Tax=Sphingomonas oligophenolica TaxID=301154 RepID=A0ABU9XZK9_9SPHN
MTDMGASAAPGGALEAQSGKHTATGYEKSEMVGGSLVTEKWSNQSSTGSYQMMVAGRFMISAEGGAPSTDTLRQAVATVDKGALAGMVRHE